jgi:hypothetical protein
MPLWLILAMLATTPPSATGGAIEATIRGTAEPLEVELLLRNPAEEWVAIDRASLPAGVRRVRFDALPAGVYQLRVRGPLPTQQLGTKTGIGSGDIRLLTIEIEPFAVSGRVTLGETELGAGVLTVRHRELHWSGEIPIGADGTFRARLWQRGAFTGSIRGPALPTASTHSLELDGTALEIAIPDGRITGIVRDTKSGAGVPGAIVALRTQLDEREENARVITNAEGRFDFAGIRYGTQTIRIYPLNHLDPEPVVFDLGAGASLRELDVRVDPGRTLAIVVIDGDHDPLANAKVLAVAESRLRARTTTDEDGRATITLPPGEEATLFVIPEQGPFGMQRVARDLEKGRLKIYMPQTRSSLLIRAQTTDGAAMPRFSLLMRYNGELVPPDVAEELAAAQGLQFMTGPGGEARLQDIPGGSYEFWPYRTDDEAQSIVHSASALLAPIHVNVRAGENEIAVKFAKRGEAARH